LADSPLEVLIVGKDSFDPTKVYDYRRKNMAHTAVECLSQGELDVEIEGRSFRVRKGDAYVLPPGVHPVGDIVHHRHAVPAYMLLCLLACGIHSDQAALS
jgi:quercetin dioxygenase-like cupin family protein